MISLLCFKHQFVCYVKQKLHCGDQNRALVYEQKTVALQLYVLILSRTAAI